MPRALELAEEKVRRLVFSMNTARVFQRPANFGKTAIDGGHGMPLAVVAAISGRLRDAWFGHIRT